MLRKFIKKNPLIFLILVLTFFFTGYSFYDNYNLDRYIMNFYKKHTNYPLNPVNNISSDKINKPLENTLSSDYCQLTFTQTFNYLTQNSPFQLGNEGEVNFTKRFDFNHNKWVEGSINISGGLNYNNRLSGKYEIIKGNLIQIHKLKAIGGNYDASNNSYTFGSFKINCNGDIEGYLKDYKGNSKDILIKK